MRFFSPKRVICIMVLLGLTGLHQAASAAPKDKKSVPSPQVKPEMEAATPSALTAELLYYILVGEFSLQRNEVAIAQEAYQHARKLTSDSGVAARLSKIEQFLAANPNAAQQLAEESPIGLALLKLKNNEIDAAYASLVAALKKQPSAQEQVFLQLGQLFSAETLPATQHQFTQQLQVAFPQQAAAAIANSLTAQKTENLAEALASAELAQKLRPDWSLAALRIAELQNISSLDTAINTLDRFLSSYPKSPDVSFYRARLYLQADQLDKALPLLQAHRIAFPDDLLAAYTLGLVALEQKNYSLAEPHLLAALAFSKQATPRVYLSLGQVYAAQNKSAEAEAAYLNVKALPELLMARRNLYQLWLKNDPEKAEKAWKTWYAEAEEAMPYILIKTESLRSKKDYTGGVAYLTQEIAQQSNTDDLYYERALLHDLAGQAAASEADLRYLLAKNADNTAALNALGFGLVERGERLDEAEKYLQKALSNEPNSPAILDSVGWLRYKQGRFNDALDYLQRAKKSSDDPDILAHWVLTLAKLKRTEEAKQALNAAMKLHGDYPALLKAQQELQ